MIQENIATLGNVRIEKSTLSDILIKNRNEHVKLFNESEKGYKQRVQEWHNKQYQAGVAGEDMETHLPGAAPFSNTEDYDKVITMLKLSVDTVFTLSEREFENYVMDKWNWSNSFYTMASGCMPV